MPAKAEVARKAKPSCADRQDDTRKMALSRRFVCFGISLWQAGTATFFEREAARKLVRKVEPFSTASYFPIAELP
jgi:hypothetical protein